MESFEYNDQVTIQDDALTSGTGTTTEKIMTAFKLCTYLPIGKGMQLNGHIALFRNNKLIDLNFSRQQLEHLKKTRTEEERMMGPLYKQFYSSNVPLKEMNMDNVGFNSVEPVSNLTQKKYKYHLNIMKSLSKEQLVQLLQQFEDTPGTCIPMAILKHMLDPSLQMVVGQFGFKDKSGKLSDVEYGDGGVQWL